MDRNQSFSMLNRIIGETAEVPGDLIDSLFRLCRLVRIREGEHFLRAGDIPEYMGLNLNGVFRLYYTDREGRDCTKGFCTEGKFVVSYSAMVENRSSYFSIEALCDTDILKFKYGLWRKMIDDDIRWYPFAFRILESVYIMKELREKSFLMDDAGTRYLDFRRKYPDLENKIKSYHIASFLGIAPETLSRIRKTMQLT